MERRNFYNSIIVFLILTIIVYILAMVGLFSVFTGNIFNISELGRFLGYLGTLLIQIIGNFFVIIINSVTYLFTYNWDTLPLNTMGVSNFNFFSSFFHSIFILFLISSIIFLIYFIFTKNSNWSIVSFVFVVMIIFMAALTPIFIELFNEFLKNYVLNAGVYGFIGVIISITFIALLSIFTLYFLYYVKNKKLKSFIYFFLILISIVFLNTFAQPYFPDFLFITMDLSNLSLSIQLKPYIYDILLNALFLSNFFPAYIQNLFGLLIYAYYFTPISNYLTSSEFFSTFFILLFLEVSFQTSYFHDVYFPTRERGKRLEKQINDLEKRFQKLSESKIEEEVEVEEIHSVSVRRFFSGAAFDYLREMMEKRKKLEKAKPKVEKKKEEELLDDDELRRLQMYIEERYKQDAKTRKSLAAEAISPKISGVIGSTFSNIIYRLITLFVLTFILFNATNIFQAIGSPIIRISVEIHAPTIISLVLFPMVLTFPVIGSVIKIRRFPKEIPRRRGIWDIGFGILGLATGILFLIIGVMTMLPEFYLISVPFWIFGGIELIYGIIQKLRKI